MNTLIKVLAILVLFPVAMYALFLMVALLYALMGVTL